MVNKPPYTITERAADSLAKIVEVVTRLRYATEFNRDIRRHRENRLRTIHASLAIEGNSLTFGEVHTIIDGETRRGRPGGDCGGEKRIRRLQTADVV